MLKIHFRNLKEQPYHSWSNSIRSWPVARWIIMHTCMHAISKHYRSLTWSSKRKMEQFLSTSFTVLLTTAVVLQCGMESVSFGEASWSSRVGIWHSSLWNCFRVQKTMESEGAFISQVSRDDEPSLMSTTLGGSFVNTVLTFELYARRHTLSYARELNLPTAIQRECPRPSAG